METGRGAAAAATCIFRGDESRWRTWNSVETGTRLRYPDGIGGVESNSNNCWHARFALEDRESEFPIDGDELLYDMLTWLKQRRGYMG